MLLELRKIDKTLVSLTRSKGTASSTSSMRTEDEHCRGDARDLMHSDTLKYHQKT